MASLKVTNFARLLTPKHATQIGVRAMSGGEHGSGAGKGGGSGGSVRDAGGAMGKREAAQEEMYFKKAQADQIAKMKEYMEAEISHHEEQIKQLEKSIKKHKDALNILKK